MSCRSHQGLLKEAKNESSGVEKQGGDKRSGYASSTFEEMSSRLLELVKAEVRRYDAQVVQPREREVVREVLEEEMEEEGLHFYGDDEPNYDLEEYDQHPQVITTIPQELAENLNLPFLD